MGFAKAYLDKMRQVQRTLAHVVVRIADGTGLSDVADGIRALVAIGGRIRRGADSHGIHYKDQGAHIASFAGSNCGAGEARAAGKSQ
jgi:hypothetical protein